MLDYAEAKQGSVDHDTVFEVADLGRPSDPPPGYSIRSMADDNDIEARREVFLARPAQPDCHA